MRPIAVLLLVLGAVGALLFAILSITGDDGRGLTNVTRPAHASTPEGAPPSADLADPIVQPATPIRDPRTVPIETGPDRDAVRSEAFTNQLIVKVLDPDDLPVADAEVSLVLHRDSTQLGEMTRQLSDLGAPRARFELVSDEEGACAFQNLDPGTSWSIVVRHDEFRKMRVGPVQVGEDMTIEEIVKVEAGFLIHGVVTDEGTGMPIVGAQITLDDPIAAIVDRKRSASRMEAESNEFGEYRFTNVVPQNRVLLVKAEGYATQLRNSINFFDPKVTAAQELEENIEMERGMLIAGRVVDADGQGLEGATVEAISHQGKVSSKGRTESGPGGEFAIGDIAEGLYTLKTTMAGWDSEPNTRVEAGETNVEVVCMRQGGVRGQVLDSKTGRPVTDFSIRIRMDHPTHPAFGSVQASQRFRGVRNGMFELGGVTKGTFRVQADGNGYASTFSEPFVVAQGEITPDIVIRLSQGGTLEGTILDSYTGKPLSGVEISTNDNNWIDSEFTNLLGGMMPSAMTKKAIRTNDKGQFRFDLMTEGDYQLVVKHPNFTEEVFNDVHITADQTTTYPPIELTKGANVMGTLYLSDGSVARGHDIFLRASDNAAFNDNKQARTDSHGRYTIRNVAPGQYKLSAARPQGTGQGGPFAAIVDMRNSEVDLQVYDGQDYTQDLYLGK